ncbi:MAG: transporter [Bacilli bacterium]|nr:transporter [Bacilli bacterium]
MTKNKRLLEFLLLHFSFFIFSLSSLFVKLASDCELFSFKFFLFFGISIVFLGVYALLWQKVLSIYSLTSAFFNKSIVIIWGMIWGLLVFHEKIKFNMIIGCILIMIGIWKVKKDE